MSNRAVKITIGVIVGVTLASGLFTAGLVSGAAFQGIRQGAHVLLPEVFSAPSTSIFTPPDLSNYDVSPETLELFSPFWETWTVVQEEYVDQPVDDIELMRGAIQGMLESLGDSNTSYMDPHEYQQANSRLEGEYEGIGVWVDAEVEYLTVISTMPGSPAEDAGLLPGDEVIAVDGDDMTGVDGTLVIRRVLGEAGTTVHLTIRREGELETLEFEIVRAKIVVPSVESELLEDGIVYLRLFDFGDNTTSEMREALKTLVDVEANGLILDLRGNPGGLLNTSVEVASEFLDGGIVLFERFGDGEEEIYRASDGGLATDIPMVVLINAGSASASEIVAAAIQDSGRGILIGATTFGKGSVQNWRGLSDDAGAIRVTVARWYTPDNRQINEIGLTPDIEVVQPEDETDTDVQLEEAINYLKSLTN
jgi:carboxyl-terminal processing protease